MSYIRFDWAIKKVLRQKANFVVLEGLLTSVFNEKVTINRILESEGNKEEESSKFNRVDILAENSKGDLFIVEVQNSHEIDYFHRILFGTSKAVTEYISEGDPYSKVKKIYSINIVYFTIGQGNDYVYHGITTFRGIHLNDELLLSPKQRQQFNGKYASDIFPEYYILRVNEFDQLAVTHLDEWISFLKTGEIPDKPTAPGLMEAKDILSFDKMDADEKRAYKNHIEDMRYEKSMLWTNYLDGKTDGIEIGKAEGIEIGKIEGIEIGKIEERIKNARMMKEKCISPDIIADITGLPVSEIEKL